MDDMLAVIEQYASILNPTSGTDHQAIAAEWAAEGFTPAETAEWAQARCFRADSAAQLRDAGITPAAASVTTRTEAYTDDLRGYIVPGFTETLGYLVANGDYSLGDVLARRR